MSLTCSDIRQQAAEKGFSAAYCFTPVPEDNAPENIGTLILLVKRYDPCEGLVDAFYPASNTAYHAAKEMAMEISANTGKIAIQLSNLRLKPMCSRLPCFEQGMNTLHYHRHFGSKFCLELIGVQDVIEDEGGCTQMHPLGCGSCKRCMEKCPTGAITPEGFRRDKCLRNYMINGKPIPEDMRHYYGVHGGAYAVIGCDVCQRACPYNAAFKYQEGVEIFSLTELLECNDDTLKRFAELYGSNYAIKNRIIAQALLAAGNSGDVSLIPVIEKLTKSLSPTVAEHARWAITCLSKYKY